MSKIMLFGSNSIAELSQEALDMIVGFNNNGYEFMLADGSGVDSAYNKWLSRIGARERSSVYAIGNVKNNKFSLKEVSLSMKYDEVEKVIYMVDSTGNTVDFIPDVESMEGIETSSKYYMAIDKYMAKQCDAAICLWDGKSKAESSVADYLSILGKPCYIMVIPI